MSRDGEWLQITRVERGMKDIRVILDEPPSHRFVTAMKELNPAYVFSGTDSTETGYDAYFYIPFSDEAEILSLLQLAKAHVAEAPKRIPAIAARWRAEKLAVEQAAQEARDRFNSIVRQAGLPTPGDKNSGCLISFIVILPSILCRIRF